MTKSHHTHTEGDIASEKYAGPSARVAAAGQGFIDHFKYAFTGLVGASILGFIFHKPGAELIKKCQNAGTWLKEYESNGNRLYDWGKDNLTTWAGRALHVIFGDPEAAVSLRQLQGHATKAVDADRLKYIAMSKEQGFGNWFLSHTLGAFPYVGKRFNAALYEATDRYKTAVAIGGVAGASGYVGGWLQALVKGSKHGNAGKHQFERAQAEIKDLRERNAELGREKERAPEDMPHGKTEHHEKSAPSHHSETSHGHHANSHAHTEHAQHDKPHHNKLHSVEHQGGLASHHGHASTIGA